MALVRYIFGPHSSYSCLVCAIFWYISTLPQHRPPPYQTANFCLLWLTTRIGIETVFPVSLLVFSTRCLYQVLEALLEPGCKPPEQRGASAQHNVAVQGLAAVNGAVHDDTVDPPCAGVW